LEKQLAFENAAIADKDGTAQLFVADHQDETADLTVFASLKKDALIRGLANPKAAGVQVQIMRSKCRRCRYGPFSPNTGSRTLICS
jgi:hypothetical protein